MNKTETAGEALAYFIDYLEEIRERLYLVLILFVGAFAIGFFMSGQIIFYLIKTFDLKGVVIATTSPFQFLDLAINIGIFVALVILVPALVWAGLSFVRPALTKSEWRSALTIIPLSFLLFCLGFAYSVFVMYYALGALATFNSGLGIANVWDVGTFLSQILMTSTFLGLLFEFPVVLSVLIRLEFLSVGTLINNRRLAVATICTVVALLPPTDGLSLLIMVVPVLGLYELTVAVNRYWFWRSQPVRTLTA